MKLSEVKTDGNLKVLAYGNAGSGKTCFAAGFPTPILYLDFDGKVDSAALFYAGNTDRLDQIDVRQLQRDLSIDPIDELIKIIETELIPQETTGTLKYKTIVLDSITTFSALCLQHIVKTNPGIKRAVSKQGQQPCMQDYAILKREFAKLIPGLLSVPCNVVMLGHIAIDKDELTGELVRGPMMDGSFAKELPIYFKEVWRSFVNEKGQFRAQTRPDSKYDCRSQIKGLPAEISLSYEELSKYL